MIYPKFIEKKDTIGITAPSDGRVSVQDINRLENAHKNLNNKRYKTIETESVRKSTNGKSADAKTRCKELEDLYKNKDVSLIISASGGEFEMEILPYLDYNIIKNNPKWIQGYSDNTILIHTITTTLDIATIYGDNIGTFGMKELHTSVENNIKILEGKLLKQESFKKYQNNYQTYKTGLEGYNLDKDVEWQNLFNEKELTIEGRLIGGCIDVLDTILGTKYDNTSKFIEKYKQDGIIWYLENCEQTCEQLTRTLWKMQELGYFKNIKGIIFGRTTRDESYYNISYKETLINFFKDYKIPIIIEADFGHKSPRMTIINGAYAIIKSKDKKGSIEYILR